MLRNSLNKKTYIGDIEPNPKEFGIWIKEDGSAKIYDYIKDEWVGGSGSGSSDGNWEYYKIDRSHASFNNEAMNVVFSFVTLDNSIYDDTLYIMPKGRDWNSTVAIAGISVKNIVGELVVDTGSWLNNIKEFDKFWGRNYDYSFLKPITKEEFYSDNFDYPEDYPKGEPE